MWRVNAPAAARKGSDDLLLRGDKLVESVPVEGFGEASVDDCAEETPTRVGGFTG